MSTLKKWARAASIIIFLALIRTVAEPFRLQNESVGDITFTRLQPYLLAALVTASGLLAMTLLYYYSKYRLVIFLAILLIGVMLYIRFRYL